MAATVPSTVDTEAAISAISKVFWIASIRAPEPCMSPVKTFMYRLVENPVQLPSTLLSVKEKMAMKTIGA
jgi:hypothetical protein